MNPWCTQYQPKFFDKVCLVLLAFDRAVRAVGIGFACLE